MSGSSEPHSQKRMPWLQDILFSLSLEFRHQVGPDPNDGIERVTVWCRSKSIYELILLP